jgi:hypothetical protein
MAAETESRITVRLKKAGWEVEITCSQSQLKDAVESVLSSLGTPSAVASPGHLNQVDAPPVSGNKTSRGLILELWQENWFSEPRSLAEVHEEIARRGFHYDKTAISHALTDLVRETTLTRQGNPRNYAYIQKRPPQQAAGPQPSLDIEADKTKERSISSKKMTQAASADQDGGVEEVGSQRV